jgi:hypothetical protein
VRELAAARRDCTPIAEEGLWGRQQAETLTVGVLLSALTDVQFVRSLLSNTHGAHHLRELTQRTGGGLRS